MQAGGQAMSSNGDGGGYRNPYSRRESCCIRALDDDVFFAGDAYAAPDL